MPRHGKASPDLNRPIDASPCTIMEVEVDHALPDYLQARLCTAYMSPSWAALLGVV